MSLTPTFKWIAVGASVFLGLWLLTSRPAESSHRFHSEGQWDGDFFDGEDCYASGDWHVSVNTDTGGFTFHFHGDTEDSDCFNWDDDIDSWCPLWVEEELYDECGICIDDADTRFHIDHHGHIFLKCKGYAYPCDDGNDNDSDEDGIPDVNDNCPFSYNPDQTDTDGDGVGDTCDFCFGFDDNADLDGDGVPDGCDSCPVVANSDQADADGDGVGDACDLCPGFDDFADADGDGIPDACDPYPNDPDGGADDDSDGVPDAEDNCPFTANSDQADADGDGVGDVCDLCPGFDDYADADGDGVPDGCDIAPTDPSVP